MPIIIIETFRATRYIVISFKDVSNTTDHYYTVFGARDEGECRASCKMVPCSIAAFTTVLKLSSTWLEIPELAEKNAFNVLDILLTWKDEEGQANVQTIRIPKAWDIESILST